jgi:uncharacterized membrane protein YgaE (UPF0421/DUF939 family)
MQTQARTAVRVAVIRVFINVISASVALVASHLGGTTTMLGLAVALLVVGLFCYLIKLDEGIRSAYICVVIIIGADRFADRSPPIDRVATVTVGSSLGVVVSWIFAKKWDAVFRKGAWRGCALMRHGAPPLVTSEAKESRNPASRAHPRL